MKKKIWRNIPFGIVMVSLLGKSVFCVEASSVGWTSEQNGYYWHYEDSNGNWHVGWLEDGGVWYYFTWDGYMASNIKIEENGKEYFFFENGAMATGWWKDSNGNWHYSESDGSIKRGWLQDDGVWYYFKDDGTMAVNETIEGHYYFDSQGRWIEDTAEDLALYEKLKGLEDIDTLTNEQIKATYDAKKVVMEDTDTVKMTRAKLRVMMYALGIYDMNEEEKVYTIYEWILDNVQYTLPASGTWIEALQGKTKCSGYSGLLQVMCEEVGISCVCVEDYKLDHGWNLIKIGDKWYWADATWDDGGDFRLEFFLKSSKDFKQHGSEQQNTYEKIYNISEESYSYSENIQKRIDIRRLEGEKDWIKENYESVQNWAAMDIHDFIEMRTEDANPEYLELSKKSAVKEYAAYTVQASWDFDTYYERFTNSLSSQEMYNTYYKEMTEYYLDMLGL